MQSSSNDQAALNPAVNLKIKAGEVLQLELVDNLGLTQKFKEQHLMPYLSALWEDLASRYEHSPKGVLKHLFIEVTVRDTFA